MVLINVLKRLNVTFIAGRISEVKCIKYENQNKRYDVLTLERVYVLT